MRLRIKPASLSWDTDGTPTSSYFDDPYFSRGQGIAESSYVFLQANQLAQRFAALKDGDSFVIAETGFGTGLNFLLTWRCFEDFAPKTARLIYISVEGYPLLPADLKRSLHQWPELQSQAEELLAKYPVLVPGHHSRLFDGRVKLQLIFDQLEPALKSLHPQITHHNFEQPLHQVDTWFLDGFAPAKNPEMWQESLYPSIARLSGVGTTLSSFTAAGSVRRSLKEWGFQVEKLPGFGKKREMISAEFDASWQPEIAQIRAYADKGAQSWHLPELEKTTPKQVIILGAGVAGLCLAQSLAQRGIKVRIYDRHPDPASGASGNPQVAIFGRLSPDKGDLEDFVLQALAHCADYYTPFWESGAGKNTGLVQLARSEKELEKMQRLIELLPGNNGLVEYIEFRQSQEYTGVSLKTDGLYFPKSGWISPPLFAKQILEHDLIEFKGGLDLKPDYKDGRWQLLDRQGNLIDSCETLVLSSGAEVLENPQFEWLPIKPVAGQVNLIPASEKTSDLKTILSKTTSICPATDGQHCFGGSYRLGETVLDIRQNDSESNLNKIKEILDITDSGFDQALEIKARTGVRATTPDYLPICGPAPDIQHLKRDFEPLSRDAKTPIKKSAPEQKGLYLNVGYGSRGYAYAPLCAEHLASLICGDPSPLPNHLQRAIHPARFPIRDIIRGRT